MFKTARYYVSRARETRPEKRGERERGGDTRNETPRAVNYERKYIRVCAGRRETASLTNEDQADLKRERVRRSVSRKLFPFSPYFAPKGCGDLCNGKAALMYAVRIALAALARYTSLIAPRRIGGIAGVIVFATPVINARNVELGDFLRYCVYLLSIMDTLGNKTPA